jgi:hypothetical protein
MARRSSEKRNGEMREISGLVFPLSSSASNKKRPQIFVFPVGFAEAEIDISYNEYCLIGSVA